jgi:DNA-binding transcriptional ArsR family regulator
MSAPHFDHLLATFKALADENRLKMAILLSQRKYNVGELAEALSLTAPTVSHHLAKLREAGLVNLETAGNTHNYRLNDAMFNAVRDNLFNAPMMEVMNEYILSAGSPEHYREKAELERARSEAWIDELDVDDFDRKVLRDYTDHGRLTMIPTRYKKLMAVLRWLATKFAPGVKYTEPEVSAILREIHADYARLRRELIEAKFLQREGGGGMYWRAADAEHEG